MKLFRTVVFCTFVLVGCVGICVTRTAKAGALWGKLIAYKRMVYFHYLENHSFPSRYTDLLSSSQRVTINFHAQRAVESLSDHSDLEIAAAVNAYLYQYLVLQDSNGLPHEILRSGYAICGGHATTMCAILDLLGVKSRLAFLIGAPYQGAHSMVEVELQNGSKALFDPTYGVVWWDKDSDEPVSIAMLLQEPALGRRCLFQSVYSKSTQLNSTPMPARCFDLDYVRSQDADDEIHYVEMFAAAKGGGASGDHVYVEIPLSNGFRDYGGLTKQGENLLKCATDVNGNYISWAHVLGSHPLAGSQVSHVYNMTDLRPGKSYELRLACSQSHGSCITAFGINCGVNSRPAGSNAMVATTDGLSSQITLVIRPNDTKCSVVLDNTGGYMTLTKIALRDVQ